MPDSTDIHALLKQYPEIPYAFMAIVSYTISIIFGVKDMGDSVEFYGIQAHTISTPLWIIFGLLSIYFLYTAFFDMWIYAIHLIFAYFLTGSGFMGLYIFYHDLAIKIFSIILIVAGIGFIYYFIYKIGNIRSYRIMNHPDPEEARSKYSLQSWYLVPFIFFAFTAISFLNLAYSYDNTDHSSIYHSFSEFIIILLVVYLLWKPENVLFYGVQEYHTPTTESERIAQSPDGQSSKIGTDRHPSQDSGGAGADPEQDGADSETSSILSKVRKRTITANCPGFDSPPQRVKKTCPSCQGVNEFNFCSQSEEYLIDCPSCNEPTYHGRKVCINCKTRLDEKVACSQCDYLYPIRRFHDM